MNSPDTIEALELGRDYVASELDFPQVRISGYDADKGAAIDAAMQSTPSPDGEQT